MITKTNNDEETQHIEPPKNFFPEELKLNSRLKMDGLKLLPSDRIDQIHK